MRRRLVLTLLLLATVPAVRVEAAAPADNAVGATDFVGVWSGKKDEWPAGRCAGGDKDVVMRLTLKANPAGQLSGEVTTGPNFSRLDSEWRVHFALPDKVEVVMTAHASCNGEGRDYDVRLRGKLRADARKLHLVVEGNNAVCPDVGCVFHDRYTLDKSR